VGKPYTPTYQCVGRQGAEVRYEDRWPIFHEKVTLVRALNAVEEGSMNYTDAGDSRNTENANLLTCEAAARAYASDFDDVWPLGVPAMTDFAPAARKRGGPGLFCLSLSTWGAGAMLIIVARYKNRIDLLRGQDDIQRSDVAQHAILATGCPRFCAVAPDAD